MADIVAIRLAMQARLAKVKLPTGTAKNLRSGALWQDKPNPPCALVTADNPLVDFDKVFKTGDTHEYHFKIVVLVSRVSERTGQDLLDGLLATTGASSIKAALDTDGEHPLESPAGAAIADYVQVKQVANYGQFTIDAVDYFGCEFSAEVLA